MSEITQPMDEIFHLFVDSSTSYSKIRYLFGELVQRWFSYHFRTSILFQIQHRNAN